MGAFSLPRFAIGRAGSSANGKINVACIGIGNQGWFAVSELMKDPRVNLVAVCDVDQVLIDDTNKKAADLKEEFDLPGAEVRRLPLYADYREMFAAIGAKFDAVTIATPDHHHYPATMMAIQRRKHVYVEKPLTHTVAEARALRAAAKSKGIISQMGNQSHANEGTRLLKEWIDAGVLGEVRDVTTWSPTLEPRQRPEKLLSSEQISPATLNWDLWLGPAAERPYREVLSPKRWRGCWDFGNGMIGDWGCHTFDAPFWALALGAPMSVEAEVSGVHPHLAPEWAEVTYRFPARGQRPPVTLKWLEGAKNKPAAPAGWEDNEKKTGLPGRGMFIFGSRNTLYAPGGRCESPQLIPNATMDEFKKNRPPATIPRVIGGPMKEWLDAIAGNGPTPGSNFEHAAPLAEMVVLGALAVRTGKRIEWDANAGRVTNDVTLNRYIEISAREGWRV